MKDGQRDGAYGEEEQWPDVDRIRGDSGRDDDEREAEGGGLAATVDRMEALWIAREG